MLQDWQDAYGHEVYDYFKGHEEIDEIVERDDGYIDVSGGPKFYFSRYDEWPEHQKEAMKYASGRVLDIGCGAGRHSLYLQDKGCDVLGIDVSPLAIEVSQSRGLRNAQVLSITQITRKLGMFDTILMQGNNFGLFGSFKKARWLLRKFHKMTSDQGRIIAESRDPYDTRTPEHLEYHEFNQKKGRMSGQVRIRIRYKKHISPWFDYLLVSQNEMKEILADTGWKVRNFINGHGTYIAIIEKR